MLLNYFFEYFFTNILIECKVIKETVKCYLKNLKFLN